MSTEEPNYKDSQKIIGQLYPVLKSKDGQVIDGFHRLAVDPNWKTLVLEEIDTEEKLLVARAVSNWQRRDVKKEEKASWINGLAEIYQKQGLKVRGESPIHGGHPKNEIFEKIVAVTGLAMKTVTNYLSDEFKQTEQARPEQLPRIPASERVENATSPEVAERFRKQVLEEEKLSPEERAKHDEQVKLAHEKREQKKKDALEKKRKKIEEDYALIEKKAVQKAKSLKAEELMKDQDFQREVLKEIGKPQIVNVTDPCPSGVCELAPNLPSMETKPVDVMAEREETFWRNNPLCRCKGCEHYEQCGAIR